MGYSQYATKIKHSESILGERYVIKEEILFIYFYLPTHNLKKILLKELTGLKNNYIIIGVCFHQVIYVFN